MKPKNFPERKNARRKTALDSIFSRYEIPEEIPINISIIIRNLERKIVPSALHVKTKKNRTAQGKRRKE